MAIKRLKINFLAMLYAVSTAYNYHHKLFLKIKNINLIVCLKNCGENAKNLLFYSEQLRHISNWLQSHKIWRRNCVARAPCQTCIKLEFVICPNEKSAFLSKQHGTNKPSVVTTALCHWRKQKLCFVRFNRQISPFLI